MHGVLRRGGTSRCREFHWATSPIQATVARVRLSVTMCGERPTRALGTGLRLAYTAIENQFQKDLSENLTVAG
jgi:hypothetical protein